jgi:hypothetical protein
VANIMGLVQLFDISDPTDPYNGEIMEKLRIVADKLDAVIKKINSYTD